MERSWSTTEPFGSSQELVTLLFNSIRIPFPGKPVLRNQQRSSFRSFLSLSNDQVIGDDKMMNRTTGPVDHEEY
jgi:hypothetical protein